MIDFSIFEECLFVTPYNESKEGNIHVVFSWRKKCLKRECIMSSTKIVSRVTDNEQQQLETYRYWQSLPIGDRLCAVWEVSEAAYAFAAAFKENTANDAQGPKRAITRLQRS